MANIPPVRSITAEQFSPDQQKWIKKLLDPLNSFMNSVTIGLSSNLTFGDNIQGQEYILEFKAQGINDFPKRFKNNLQTKPKSVVLVGALEDFLPVIVNFSWQMTPDGLVEINNAVKLVPGSVLAFTADKTYKLTFRTMP
jgi:hypothetical protein